LSRTDRNPTIPAVWYPPTHGQNMTTAVAGRPLRVVLVLAGGSSG